MLPIITERVCNALDKNGKEWAVALDLSKALRGFGNAGLLDNLKGCGISGIFFDLIQSFLNA